jgi:phytoene desaturase
VYSFIFLKQWSPTTVLDRQIKTVVTKKNIYEPDLVISSADYHFTDSKLYPERFRSYSDAYWNKKIMAPSCLLYYVGLNKKLKGAVHHSLFFDTSFEKHGNEIYINPQWPETPLFYVSMSSVSDKETAPAGCENIVLLVPIASGLSGDTEAIREKYFQIIFSRLEKHIGEPLKEFVVYKKSYSISDFRNDFNSFKGNAYGMANTLMQTAVFRPSCRSKKNQKPVFCRSVDRSGSRCATLHY